jgi:hypothetical protein
MFLPATNAIQVETVAGQPWKFLHGGPGKYKQVQQGAKNVSTSF